MTQNSSDQPSPTNRERLANLIFLLKERSGRNFEEVMERLSQQGFPLSKAQFNIRYRNHQNFRAYDPQEVLAVIHTFYDGLDGDSRCRVFEAILILEWTSCPLSMIVHLEELYGAQPTRIALDLFFSVYDDSFDYDLPFIRGRVNDLYLQAFPTPQLQKFEHPPFEKIQINKPESSELDACIDEIGQAVTKGNINATVKREISTLLRKAQAADNQRALAKLFYISGHFYQQSDEPVNAEQSFRNAEKLALVHRRDLLPKLYANLGTIAFNIDEFTAAKEHFENAIREAQEQRDWEPLIYSIRTMGQIAEYRDQAEEAMKRYREAQQLAKLHGISGEQARNLLYLATVEMNIHDYEQAVEHLWQAYAIIRQEQSTALQIEILIRLSDYHVHRKDPQGAEKKLEDARSLASSHNPRYMRDDLSMRLIRVRLIEGKHREALQLIIDWLTRMQTPGSLLAFPYACAVLMLFFVEHARSADKQIGATRAALDVYFAHNRATLINQDHEAITDADWKAAYDFCQLDEALGVSYEEAVEVCKRVLKRLHA